jgi:nitrate/nitrite transport system substrate-binding protein
MKNNDMKKLAFRLSILAITCLGIVSCKKEAKTEEVAAESATASKTEKLALEKPQVTLGFIKLTDMAPLAIAKEKGFFEDEGLFVTVEAQSNWKNVLDRVIDGEIDGSHMLAGQPIAAAVGFGRQAKLVTAFSMDLNGNAITVSNDVWSKMKPGLPMEGGKPVHPISASALKPVIAAYKNENKPFKMGMVFPVSTHNYQLRYWLAAGGINPGMYTKDNVQGMINAEALLSVTPPPQMPATLEAGTINGYCVGEPWNQQAVAKGIGVPVITSNDIWNNHPEKVFVMTEEFVAKNPNTALAITKALIRAGKWLDDPKNRAEAVKILSSPAYVGADEAVLGNSMTGTFEYEKGDKRDEPDFNIFFKNNATYPFYSDGIWYMTQMRRWGQITEAKSDEWYESKIKEVYKPELWKKAAALLVKEGFLTADEVPDTDGYKPASSGFIDGIEYDGKKPLEYLKKLKIGNSK